MGENFKVDLKKVMCEDMNWFHLLQDGVHLCHMGNTEMHLQVP
jgi:sulfur transfer complex TusBCD TusB component (DsrH family)